MPNEEYDVVVIGHGAAGMTAAAGAKEADPAARVLVLERSSFSERGGNTKWTSAFMRADSVDAVAPGFADDFAEFSGGRSDRHYVERLQREAPSALAWLQSLGCTFESEPMFFLTVKRPRLAIRGGGAAILEALEKHFTSTDVEIRYDTTAEGLVTQDGRVTGVTVRTGDEVTTVGTRAVILACGGFQGSPELMGAHVGEDFADLPTVAKGGRYNQGDGLRMALAVGAGTAGQMDGYHCEPVDPRSHLPEAINMLFPYGILVNGYGQRFVDEGSKTIDESYEAVTRLIAAQPAHLAYFIADESLFTIDGWQRAVLTDRSPVKADGVDELARKLDIDEPVLRETIGSFNHAAVQNDLADRNPFGLDGLATTGLTPPKSNWAVPLDTGRLIAWPLTTAIVFTFGGIQVDADTRVLTEAGTAVEGLYAAGECTGLYYDKYPGATSVMRAVTFGRIAGRSAVQNRSEGAAAR